MFQNCIFVVLLALVKSVLTGQPQCGIEPLKLHKFQNKEFNRNYITENGDEMREVRVIVNSPQQCVAECAKNKECAAAEFKPDEFHYCRHLMTLSFIPDIEVALQDIKEKTFVTILGKYLGQSETYNCK